MNSISHKWISCSFYYPRTYELCPALKPVSTHCMALVYPISQLYLCTELKILFLWTLLIVF